MVRPETIRVADATNASLVGIVDSASFIGDRLRIVVTGAAAKPLVVDAPNSVDVKAGDRVGLHIDADAVRLLPEET
jgi:putative spermidine/putrescine transport system ATP-binding protein